MPNTTPLIRRVRAATLVVLVTLALSACATTQAPSDSALSGRWRLDPAASSNIGAVVDAAITSAQTRLRKRQRFVSGGGPARGASAGDAGGTDENFDQPSDLFGRGGFIGPDFGDLRNNLMQSLGTPTTLVLGVQTDVVEIQRDQLPAIDYRAGETITRFEEYGTARLDSSWHGGVFVMRQRYTSGARLVEQFEVDHSGALVYTRSLSDPTVGNLQVKSVYHRA